MVNPRSPEPCDHEKARFRRDVVWNLGAFLIVGMSGIALNLVIARIWDAAVLGAINQILTFHILLGQVGAFGVHLSALRFIPKHVEDPATLRAIVVAAVVLMLPFAIVTSLATWLCSGLFGRWLDSPAVTSGLVAVAPAVGLFAVNKLLANVLNGLRSMRMFAVTQAARPVFLLSSAAVAGYMGVAGLLLAWIVTIAEALLLIILLPAVIVSLSPRTAGRSDWRVWVRDHWEFGSRAAIAGWISEANTRVDVLVVGLFASDRVVGIYSAASTIVEGLVQLPTVLRNNVNPLLAQHAARGDRESLQRVVRQSARMAAIVMAPAAAIGIAVYPLFAEFVLGDAAFLEAWPAFSIAAAGVAVAAWMMPMDSYLNQVGLPGQQTAFKLVALLLNLASLLALVPLLGITGAGAAAAITFVGASMILQVIVARHIARLH